MRNTLIGLLLGLALGVAGAMLLRTNPTDTGDRGGGADYAPAATGERVYPAGALASAVPSNQALERRLEAIEASLGRLLDALESAKPSSEVPASAKAGAPIGVKSTDSVETIRRAWTAILDRNEENLLPDAPRDGKSNPIYDAYMTDIRTARAALQGAQTAEDMKRLARERPGVFKFD